MGVPKFSAAAMTAVRSKCDVSQASLSRSTGVSRSVIIAYEAGKSCPSLDIAFRLASELNCSVYDFSDEKQGDVAKLDTPVGMPNTPVAKPTPALFSEAFIRASVDKYESGQKITLEEEKAAGEFYWRTGSTGRRPVPVEEPMPGDIDELPPASFQPFTRTGNREEARWGGPVVQPTLEDIVEDEPPLTDEDRAALIERERQRLERATPSPTGPVRQPWTWTPSIFDKVAE